jgi:hypothetical protein
MARWVRFRGARTSRAFEQIEIRRNLPASWAAEEVEASRAGASPGARARLAGRPGS